VHVLLGYRASKRKKLLYDEKHVLQETPALYSVDFDSEMGSLSMNKLLFLYEI
jgi:hypothetical protein